MSLRDDLLPTVEALRQLPEQLGLRRYAVTIRRRAWTLGQPGMGQEIVTDLAITPRPKVRAMSTNEVAESGGTYQNGDFRVEKITPRYTTPTTGGYSPDMLQIRPANDAEDVCIILTGDEGAIECNVVSFNFDRNFGYTLVVRPRRVTEG